MSANAGTSTEVTIAALAAVWRAITARTYPPDTADEACATDCDAADTLAWWIALTPAASLAEIATKLRIYAHETRPGASAIGDALLASILSDAARLSGDAEAEPDPDVGLTLLERLRIPVWRTDAAQVASARPDAVHGPSRRSTRASER
jgi:hypothetical protein